MNALRESLKCSLLHGSHPEHRSTPKPVRSSRNKMAHANPSPHCLHPAIPISMHTLHYPHLTTSISLPPPHAAGPRPATLIAPDCAGVVQGVVAIPSDWQIQADVLLSSGLRPKQVVDAMILEADKAGECITDAKALHHKVSAAPQ